MIWREFQVPMVVQKPWGFCRKADLRGKTGSNLLLPIPSAVPWQSYRLNWKAYENGVGFLVAASAVEDAEGADEEEGEGAGLGNDGGTAEVSSLAAWPAEGGEIAGEGGG